MFPHKFPCSCLYLNTDLQIRWFTFSIIKVNPRFLHAYKVTSKQWFLACEPGMYGPRCGYPCGDCLEGTVCSPENGSCPKGCNKPGFYNITLYDQMCQNYDKCDC